MISHLLRDGINVQPYRKKTVICKNIIPNVSTIINLLNGLVNFNLASTINFMIKHLFIDYDMFIVYNSS